MSGPSGVGKTTIARRVEARLGGSFSISATTRPKSAGDVEGRDYYFIDEDRFKAMIDAGEFLEHACVFGQSWYGTPRRPVEDRLERDELVILDIDVQGAIQVRRTMPGALLVFILPQATRSCFAGSAAARVTTRRRSTGDSPSRSARSRSHRAATHTTSSSSTRASTKPSTESAHSSSPEEPARSGRPEPPGARSPDLRSPFSVLTPKRNK